MLIALTFLLEILPSARGQRQESADVLDVLVQASGTDRTTAL